ncbi:hypothetical protein [Sphingobium sp. SCG-1]|nr:hypothetical protein [Sphingobium sp. SCG-1]
MINLPQPIRMGCGSPFLIFERMNGNRKVGAGGRNHRSWPF